MLLTYDCLWQMAVQAGYHLAAVDNSTRLFCTWATCSCADVFTLARVITPSIANVPPAASESQTADHQTVLHECPRSASETANDGGQFGSPAGLEPYEIGHSQKS